MRGVARRSSFGFLSLGASAGSVRRVAGNGQGGGEDLNSRANLASGSHREVLSGCRPLYAESSERAMVEIQGLKLAPSAAMKEKRLAALLAGRSAAEPALEEALVSAQVRGSLELAGRSGTPEEPGWRQRSAAAPSPPSTRVCP